MKRKILLLLICFIHLSCQKEKEESFQNIGEITGIDVSGCISVASCPRVCGGLIFHFIDTSYNANIPLDNPGIFKLGPNTNFPVYVKINWQNTTRCGIVAIKITSYKIL